MDGRLTDMNGLKKSYPLGVRSSYPVRCDRGFIGISVTEGQYYVPFVVYDPVLFSSYITCENQPFRLSAMNNMAGVISGKETASRTPEALKVFAISALVFYAV